jgi:pimeloyl-ACP methyl ester carboxylesterase
MTLRDQAGHGGAGLTEVISAPDGRRLAVDSLGASDGIPIFLLHGTPGSRRGPRPRAAVLYRLGIRLICYDRPGYGRSDRHRRRCVADAAADVTAVADHLGLTTFGVVGRSGGAPHALACAALLAGRVQSAAALVGLAPPDATDLAWYDGMADSNTTEFGRAQENPRVVAATLTERAKQVRDDPEFLLKLLEPELTRQDHRVVDEVAIQRLLTETYAEACRRGAQGWIDDVLALRSPWGFDLEKIDVPVLIWHGQEDVFSPVSHARWLADHIRCGRDDARVEVVVKPDAAHFDAVKILPDILTWVKGTVRSEGLRVEGAHQPAFFA